MAPALSAKEQGWVQTYQALLKRGLPEGAIRHKMATDGIPPHVQDAVFASSPSSPANGSGRAASRAGEEQVSPQQAQSALSAADEAIVKKFGQKLKVGLPKQAVEREMKAAGVSAELQDIIMGRKKAPTVPPPSAAGANVDGSSSSRGGRFGNNASGGASNDKVSQLSLQDEKIAGPFRDMFKIGIPRPALMGQMAMANVPQNVQDSVLAGEVAPPRSTIADVIHSPVSKQRVAVDRSNAPSITAMGTAQPSPVPVKARVTTQTTSKFSPVKSFVPKQDGKAKTPVRNFVPAPPMQGGTNGQQQQPSDEVPEFQKAAAAMNKKRQEKWDAHVAEQQPKPEAEEKEPEQEGFDFAGEKEKATQAKKEGKKKTKKKKKRRKKRHRIQDKPDNSTDCGCCIMM